MFAVVHKLATIRMYSTDIPQSHLQAEADLWNADPFDPQAQARIAERIQQEHIAHNYEQAYENNPEVTCLFISITCKQSSRAAFARGIRIFSVPSVDTFRKTAVALLPAQNGSIESCQQVFVQVDMLYVNLEINRHTVAAFVDSGAQMTIVSKVQVPSDLRLMHSSEL